MGNCSFFDLPCLKPRRDVETYYIYTPPDTPKGFFKSARSYVSMKTVQNMFIRDPEESSVCEQQSASKLTDNLI